MMLLVSVDGDSDTSDDSGFTFFPVSCPGEQTHRAVFLSKSHLSGVMLFETERLNI